MNPRKDKKNKKTHQSRKRKQPQRRIKNRKQINYYHFYKIYQGRSPEADFKGFSEDLLLKEKDPINKETEYPQRKIITKTINQGRGII